MSAFVFEPSHGAVLPVAGSIARYPVRRVYCVGRNYAAHAREMGADPEREPPFFFCKPGDPQSVVSCTGTEPTALPFPSLTQNYHHEVELVVAIGGRGKDLSIEQAIGLVWGYAVGLDMTRRDLQNAAKAAGKPWEIAKAHDFSAPVGSITPAHGRVLTQGAVRLSVNGQIRQQGDLADLIWSIPEVVARLSTLFELHPGDLIFTGTPDGVGPVVRGDEVLAEIDGLEPLRIKLV
jgi:fumarylpyruvate hydrolase